MNVHTMTGELTHECIYWKMRVNTRVYIHEQAS